MLLVPQYNNEGNTSYLIGGGGGVGRKVKLNSKLECVTPINLPISFP